MRAIAFAVALSLACSPALAQFNELPNNSIMLGHLGARNPTGLVPVATLCGAQPDAGSSDATGTITNVGTTTCTITFSVPFTVIPACIVEDYTSGARAMNVVPSISALTITGLTAADRLGWICLAKSGL